MHYDRRPRQGNQADISAIEGWPSQHIRDAVDREAAARRAEHDAIVRGDDDAVAAAADSRGAAIEDRHVIEIQAAGQGLELLRLAARHYPEQTARVILGLPGIMDLASQHLAALDRLDDITAIVAQEVSR